VSPEEQKHVNAGFISVSHTSGLRMSDKVANSVSESERKGALAKMRTSDKSDRATVEQALDTRTRMVLFKMISRRVLR
jgi:RIO kinase 1